MTPLHKEPTLDLESELLHTGARLVACVDEVGRGAIAGPVVLGVVVLTSPVSPIPTGIRDSKLLSAKARQRMLPQIEEWASSTSVGSATAHEIDELGIMKAMGLAGQRALEQISLQQNKSYILDPSVDVVLLDGNIDYLKGYTDLRVVTQTKADLTCAGVAAASIVAKCHRDSTMADLALAHPGYGFESNKGYASAQHIQALSHLGVSAQHRSSWTLPGVSG